MSERVPPSNDVVDEERVRRVAMRDRAERAEAERDQARAEVERLREALAGIVDEENTVSHAHLRPGIWDDDNVPALAGKPCERCAAFARARAALGSSGEVGMLGADGEVLGLGGGAATPFNHQAGRGPIPADKRPSACWINRALPDEGTEG